MGKRYKLAAFDMDGTLLDSHKKIRDDSISALQKAADCGKCLCLSTGRNPAEIEEYRNIVPMIRYYICTSGALVLDARTGEKVYEKAFDYNTVLKMLEPVTAGRFVTQLLGTESNLLRRDLNYLEECGMGQFRRMFEKIGVMHDNFLKDYMENPYPVYKINYYCADKTACDDVMDMLADLDITVCHGDHWSLECSPKGVSKAKGLEKLCKAVNIDMSEAIAVGDSNNDLEILRAAGLGAAMGNADENIKQAADIVLANCDSNGIEQLIMNYLI